MGQVLDFSKPPEPTKAAPLPIVPESARIRIGENGYVHGVDGMLDQIAGALTKHAGPMLVRDVLPAVQRDRQLHTNIGMAIGQTVATEWRPWIIAGVGILGIIAVVQVARWSSGR